MPVAMVNGCWRSCLQSVYDVFTIWPAVLPCLPTVGWNSLLWKREQRGREAQNGGWFQSDKRWTPQKRETQHSYEIGEIWESILENGLRFKMLELINLKKAKRGDKSQNLPFLWRLLCLFWDSCNNKFHRWKWVPIFASFCDGFFVCFGRVATTSFMGGSESQNLPVFVTASLLFWDSCNEMDDWKLLEKLSCNQGSLLLYEICHFSIMVSSAPDRNEW